MLDFDKVLIDPTPTELKQALRVAAEVANYRARSRRLDWPPADLPPALVEVGREAEGWRQWLGGEGKARSGDARTALALAWWSDRAGRKHYRVVARRGEFNSAARQNILSPGERRPPLWLVYPEHLYLRRRGDGWGMVAVCPCGAAGPPEALGWMGPCCGPCHDRREAGEVPTGSASPTVLPGHTKPVVGVRFSPNGDRLLSWAEYDSTVRLWDLPAGRSTAWEWRGWVWSMAFSPDGRLVALGGSWGGVNLVDVPSGTYRSTLAAPGRPALALAFSPDGATLAVAFDRPTHLGEWDVTLWDPADSTQKPFSPGRGRRARCLAFARDGATLAAALDDENVTLWDVAAHQARAVLRPDTPSLWYVPALALAPDGRTLATIDASEVRLWDVASGQQRQTFQGGASPSASVAFSPDGSVLAWVGGDGTVRFAEAESGRPRGAFRWHGGGASGLAFSPDGRWLATGGGDGLVKLWPWQELLGNQR